jgi:glycosyltransferase involved in cell wall biosynthesis
MMRIALLTTQFPGARMGGIGTYTVQAAIALAAAGHEPHIFTLTLPADALRNLPEKVWVHQVPDLAAVANQATAEIISLGPGAYRFAVSEQFYQCVKSVHEKTPFDVIEAPEYEALAAAFIARPLYDVAVVTQLHSCSAINVVGNALDERSEPIDYLEAFVILGADGVCAPTHAVVRATREILGVTAEPQIIPLPFSPPAAPFSPPPENGPVLFVGRIERLKGADILGLAAEKFLRACQGAAIEFAGPDTPTAPGKKSMREFLEGLIPPGLRDRIQFLGELSAADIRNAMARAAIVCIPSRYENFSQVACEAMAAGRAIVCSGKTGPAEFLGAGGATFEHENPDSLAEVLTALYQNPKKRTEMGCFSHNFMQKTGGAFETTNRRIEFYRNSRNRMKNRVTVKLDSARLFSGKNQVTPGLLLLKIFESRGTDRPLFLYGAGRHTARLLAEKFLWESKNFSIAGIIDDHPRFAGGGIHLGLPVCSRQAMAEKIRGGLRPVVVLSTDTLTKVFFEQSAVLAHAGAEIMDLYAKQPINSGD